MQPRIVAATRISGDNRDRTPLHVSRQFCGRTKFIYCGCAWTLKGKPQRIPLYGRLSPHAHNLWERTPRRQPDECLVRTPRRRRHGEQVVYQPTVGERIQEFEGLLRNRMILPLEQADP
jgi:hypothetical protein